MNLSPPGFLTDNWRFCIRLTLEEHDAFVAVAETELVKALDLLTYGA
jgi:hypothetical protein